MLQLLMLLLESECYKNSVLLLVSSCVREQHHMVIIRGIKRTRTQLEK